MKEIILIMAVLFLLFPLANATTGVIVYDDFEDASINTAIWNNVQAGTGSTFTYSEGSGNLYANVAKIAGMGGSESNSVYTSKFFNLTEMDSFINNVAFRVELYYSKGSAGSSGSATSAFSAFGNTILSMGYSGSGSDTGGDTSTWTFVRTGTNTYQYYNDGVSTGSITATNSNFSGVNSVSGDVAPTNAYTKFYDVNYTLRRSVIPTLTYPASGGAASANPVRFNASASTPLFSPTTFNIVNATIYIWNSTNSLINTTNKSVTGVQNNTYFDISLPAIGSYKWNVLACTSYDCSFADSNSTITYGYTNNAETYNTTAYETATEDYTLNITLTSSSTLSAASLVYNGTIYAGTITSSGTDKIVSRELTMNSVTGSKSFYWDLVIDGQHFNSTAHTQEVNQTVFGLCNSTLATHYIDFTFKDESTLAVINASVYPATFVYYLGDGSETKTYSFSNTTENYNYSFCFSPQTQLVNVDIDFPYGSTGYPQRTFNPSVQSYTNSSTQRILYLLSSSDGLYVTFQVINNAEQVLEGVIVNATRSIDGADTVVGAGTTGADGGITFWLNPDYPHTFTFYHLSYPLYTTTITPTQSSYTVTLGSTSETNATNYQQGITWSIKPILTQLQNSTSYTFNFTISTSYWDLEGFGFNITNEDGTRVATNSSVTSSGGIVSFTLNTGNNETFYMTAYYTIENTTVEVSRTWYITIASTEASPYSIAHLFSRFSTYVSSGFFGLDDFGLGLVCFFVILITVGTIKMKRGISNEATLIGLIFALVALLDMSFGLIPSPLHSVDNFPTIFVGFIFAGFLLKEVFQ